MLKFYVECGKQLFSENVKIFKKVILFFINILFFRRKIKESDLIFGNVHHLLLALPW
jgi:hypothetical protein